MSKYKCQINVKWLNVEAVLLSANFILFELWISFDPALAGLNFGIWHYFACQYFIKVVSMNTLFPI